MNCELNMRDYMYKTYIVCQICNNKGVGCYVVFIFLCDFVDSQIIEMCSTEDDSRHSYQPMYFKASDVECSCNITGYVTRVEILQTMSAKLLIQSNDSNLFGIKFLKSHKFIYPSYTKINM